MLHLSLKRLPLTSLSGRSMHCRRRSRQRLREERAVQANAGKVTLIPQALFPSRNPYVYPLTWRVEQSVSSCFLSYNDSTCDHQRLLWVLLEFCAIVNDSSKTGSRSLEYFRRDLLRSRKCSSEHEPQHNCAKLTEFLFVQIASYIQSIAFVSSSCAQRRSHFTCVHTHTLTTNDLAHNTAPSSQSSA